MKQVVNTKQNVVTVKEMDCHKYYGAKADRTGSICFLTREKYMEGNYVWLAPDVITKGNRWGKEHETLEDAAEEIMSVGYEVYEFDNPAELFEWVVAQCKAYKIY